MVLRLLVGIALGHFERFRGKRDCMQNKSDISNIIAKHQMTLHKRTPLEHRGGQGAGQGNQYENQKPGNEASPISRERGGVVFQVLISGKILSTTIRVSDGRR
uniref:Uncharacterized protein n=1 Tax=Eutreptiella gymnastica TaxID=73025 RepID=A0A7S4D0J3_9EUGL